MDGSIYAIKDIPQMYTTLSGAILPQSAEATGAEAQAAGVNIGRRMGSHDATRRCQDTQQQENVSRFFGTSEETVEKGALDRTRIARIRRVNKQGREPREDQNEKDHQTEQASKMRPRRESRKHRNPRLEPIPEADNEASTPLENDTARHDVDSEDNGLPDTDEGGQAEWETQPARTEATITLNAETPPKLGDDGSARRILCPA